MEVRVYVDMWGQRRWRCGLDRWRWVAVSLQDVNCVPFGTIGPKGIKLSPPHLCFLFPPPSHFTLLSLQISDEILLNGFLSLLLLLLLNQPCGGAAIHSSCFSHNSSWEKKDSNICQEHMMMSFSLQRDNLNKMVAPCTLQQACCYPQ